MSKCNWPDCAKALKCSVCGEKLCRHIESDKHRIIGHFNYDKKIFCEKCWDDQKQGDTK